jgi:hypothetical protein
MGEGMSEEEGTGGGNEGGEDIREGGESGEIIISNYQVIRVKR